MLGNLEGLGPAELPKKQRSRGLRNEAKEANLVSPRISFRITLCFLVIFSFVLFLLVSKILLLTSQSWVSVPLFPLSGSLDFTLSEIKSNSA